MKSIVATVEGRRTDYFTLGADSFISNREYSGTV